MKFPVLAALLACLLSPLCAEEPETKLSAPAGKSAPAAKTLIDALSEAELDEFIAQLRDHFIKPELLSDLEVKRATVQGLFTRLAPGVTLVEPTAAGADGPGPFRSEILDNRIGYARLGSTTPENIAALDTALAGFAEKKLAALVLDLRATPPGSEFEQAVEVCRRFVPKGKVLFTVKRANVKNEEVLTSKDDPVFRGIAVVLVDHDTAGAAEVIAAVLRTHVRAMVIGQQTRGEAVEFKNLPLPGGKVLRIAVAEVTLPDSAPVFPGGVKPDVPVDVSRETTEAVLKQGLESGVAGLVFETERARMNEAALVAGVNPELDAALAAQQTKGEKPKPPLRDAVLQRAVDFVTTVAIYEKQKAKK
jgi:hypothetical protein